jgi:hypothetical protein
MIELSLPTLPERELTLESDDPSRDGSDSGAPGLPPLEGRVTLGGPLALPLTPDQITDDPVLRAYVEQEAAHSVYHLVHLSLSFAGQPGAPRLTSAKIELKLSSTSTGTEPIAWSMTPLRVTDTTQMERGFTLGPSLKLSEMEASVGEIKQTVTGSRTEVFLQALRELQPDPAWEFTRTRDMDLYGSYRLIMVVRAPLDGATSLSSTVRAATRTGLLRKYRRELPEPLTLVSVL